MQTMSLLIDFCFFAKVVGWLLFAEKQWFTKRSIGLVWYLHIPQGPTKSSPRSAEIAMQSISCFPSDTAFNKTKKIRLD